MSVHTAWDLFSWHTFFSISSIYEQTNRGMRLLEGPKGPVIPAFQDDPRQYLQAMLSVTSPKREDWRDGNFRTNLMSISSSLEA